MSEPVNQTTSANVPSESLRPICWGRSPDRASWRPLARSGDRPEHVNLLGPVSRPCPLARSGDRPEHVRIDSKRPLGIILLCAVLLAAVSLSCSVNL